MDNMRTRNGIIVEQSLRRLKKVAAACDNTLTASRVAEEIDKVMEEYYTLTPEERKNTIYEVVGLLETSGCLVLWQ